MGLNRRESELGPPHEPGDQSVLPTALYVHVPFCRHRCGYCNFSLVANRTYLVERYLRAISLELQQLPPLAPLSSLYLGGGTPSHLSPSDLATLMRTLRSAVIVGEQAEITMEANPLDVTPELVTAWRAAGINRISLGAQSFDDNKLRFLERDHDATIIQRAVKLLSSGGFTISLDLIFATPGETCRDWQNELELAQNLPIHHLSTYELTYEKGTSFWNRLQRGELARLDEDLRGDLYALTLENLNQNQWQHYEISSFCRERARCRHNQVYWDGSSWLAVGPGAASFYQGERWTNHSSTSRYLQLVEQGHSPVAGRERLLPADAARELLAIGLRQIDGLSLDRFQRLAGGGPDSFAGQAIEELVNLGLLSIDGQFLKLTSRGIMLYDSIAAEILTAR